MSKQNPNIPVSSIEDDEMTLRDLILKIRFWWKYFLSHWLIILVLGLSGGVLGLMYATNQKPIYTASLSFVLEEEQSASIGGLGALAGQFGINVGGGGGGAFAKENLLELMRSRSLVEKTLLTPVKIGNKDQTLAEYYIEFNRIRDDWKDDSKMKQIQFLPNADRSNFTLGQDSVLGTLYNNIVTNNLIIDNKDSKSSIIIVKVNSENELFSKTFAEVLIKEVSDFYVDTKTKKSNQNLSILEQKTDSVRRALNSAISGVASSIDANPNANPSRMVLRTPSQLRQVDVEANKVMLTELVKNLEVARISLRRETPLIQIIDKPILPLDKKGFGKRKGVIIGGLIGGFLALGFIFGKKLISEADLV